MNCPKCCKTEMERDALVLKVNQLYSQIENEQNRGIAWMERANKAESDARQLREEMGRWER